MAFQFPFMDNGAYQGGTEIKFPRNLIYKPNYAGGQQALVLAPGLESIADTGTDMEIRGMAVVDDVAYIVAGNKLFSLNDKLQLTEIGGDELLTKAGPVTMDFNDALNNHHLVICDGTYSYCYRETTEELTRISTDTHDFVGGASVTFMNGRWIFNEIDNNRFFWSNLNNGLSYDSSDYLGVQSPTGNILRVLVDRDMLVVFKKSGIAYYANFASNGNPFTLRSGADMSIGLHAKNAVTKLDNTIYWLGEDLNVYRANGFSPVVISPHHITKEFESYEVTDDAIAYSYVYEGLPYLSLTFPTAGKSWLYDPATKRWFERSSYRSNKSSDGRHRGNCYVKFGERHLVGDYENGRIYEMKSTTYKENSESLRWSNTCPIWDNNRELFEINQLEIVCSQGSAAITGAGSAPRICLRYSKDGGHTWSQRLWRDMGLRGKYDTRVTWNRLGSARSLQVELSGSSPIPWAIIGAYVK